MRKKYLILSLIFTFAALSQEIFAQTNSIRSITIFSEPEARIWVDDVLRGKTDSEGKLMMRNVPSGIRRLRIRANGFKENLQTITATQKGELKIALVKSTDEAELTFQQAEAMSTKDRQKAAEIYRKAIKLRPTFAEAHLGLARVLSEAGEDEESLTAIAEARKVRAVFPEISAIEGRIYKSLGEEEKAVASFKRAIREGKNYQPEAHTGLGLLYKERAEGFASEGDLENETANYNLAVNELRTALTQLGGAPDAEIIYQMLGVIYEKQQKFTEAINLYEEFLRLFPDSNEVTAIRSFIVQAQKQMRGEQ